MPDQTAPGPYLIYCHERAKWWAPGRRGYTSTAHDAGLYPEAEARKICDGANYRFLMGATDEGVQEVMIEAAAVFSCLSAPDYATGNESIIGLIRSATSVVADSRRERRSGAMSPADADGYETDIEEGPDPKAGDPRHGRPPSTE